jgi:RNA ligase (TIGR02306 family)
MSSLIVDVCTVEEIASHPNADKIERVRVKNWWCVASKGHYKVGDKAVYVPPDAVLPEALAERWGIAKYCCQLPKEINGERKPGLRVKASRFRGVSSFGTIQDPDDPSWEVGLDVREHYGITKYEPPMKCSDGDAAPPHPHFYQYTSIENIGNFPGVFKDGDTVYVTEKIHGTNSRVGYVMTGTNEHGDEIWEFMAGSHSNRRKEFNDKGVRSMYWLPFAVDSKDDPLRMMLTSIMFRECAKHSVIVFGEIFGAGVQDMQYGQKGKSFRVFDICVDGIYLDAERMLSYVRDFNENGLQTVPCLYIGPFSMEKMNELVDGPTTICSVSDIKEPFKGREGVVIKPVKESFDDTLGGRKILKYISVDYHDRRNKDKTEDH